MRQLGRIGVLSCSALAALGLAGCVTETVPPPEIHTSAFVTTDEPDAPAANTPLLSNTTTAANQAVPQNAPAPPAMAVPAMAPPAPPIPAVPPVIH